MKNGIRTIAPHPFASWTLPPWTLFKFFYVVFPVWVWCFFLFMVIIVRPFHHCYYLSNLSFNVFKSVLLQERNSLNLFILELRHSRTFCCKWFITTSTNREIKKFLKGYDQILHDSPVRRADHITITNNFPLVFCSTRWIEDGAVADRLQEIWPEIFNHWNNRNLNFKPFAHYSRK